MFTQLIPHYANDNNPELSKLICFATELHTLMHVVGVQIK